MAPRPPPRAASSPRLPGAFPAPARHPLITVVIASRLHEDRLDYLTAMHASLTRQSVPWEAVIALDGNLPNRLPAPLAQDPRVRTLALPRPVGAACARNLALAHVRTRYTNWADDDDEFTDDAMSVRLNTLESTGVGWCAGWSEDQHQDGSTTLWRCPTPPGRHEAGDVWTYWKSPAGPSPSGRPRSSPAPTSCAPHRWAVSSRARTTPIIPALPVSPAGRVA